MYEKLKEIISRVMPDLDLSNVSEDSRLLEDLKFDSLAIMMMAMEIESEFGIRFEGPVALKTVKDVMNYIEEKQK
ncbi:MAG: acyl carrier protein [Bacilli bacterium]|nr:acyl carrier protein [Bacilli bacterium]